MEIDQQEMVNTNVMEVDGDDINEHDRISGLPDPVLALILSFLPIREAVRTTAVSRKWNNLFKSPMSIVLDAHNMLDMNKYSNTDVSRMDCLERNNIKIKRTSEFIKVVWLYLKSIKKIEKIKKFKVYFTFGNAYADGLNWCIKSALKKKVEEIDLFLLEDDYFSAPIEHLYVFPCDRLAGTLSSLKHLSLAYCFLAPGPQLSIFNTLKTLKLMNVDLASDDNFRNLLWNCRDIEFLSLNMCWNMKILGIVSPNCQKLKYLNVTDCRDLRAIELKGLNVETLEYKGRSIRFQFYETARLTTVFTGVNDWMMSYSDIWPICMLPIYLPQLQTWFLLMNAKSLQIMEIDPHPRMYLGNGRWHQLEPYKIWTRTEKDRIEHYLHGHAGESVRRLTIL